MQAYSRKKSARKIANTAHKPLVSVVMAAYNSEKYIRQAIESILHQTYRKFEFIILDDGSTDNTSTILAEYADPRLRIFRHDNMGPAASWNKGIDKAKGEYIARQDADDISLPTRFEKQLNFLQSRPDIAMLGTSFEVIDDVGKTMYTFNAYTHPDDLKLAIVLGNQFGHGSMMLRRLVFDRIGKYIPARSGADDYELWIRVLHELKAANLKEPLYRWRTHSMSIGRTQNAKHQETLRVLTDKEFNYFRNHLRDYTLPAPHPFSTNLTPTAYLRARSELLQTLASRLTASGLRRYAVPLLLLAIIHSPNKNDLYREFLATFKKNIRS